MSISVGGSIPDVELYVTTEDGPAAKSSAEFFKGRKVVLFAVPGAFTPTCHLNHAPGFISNAEAIKAKGVDEIACVAVNDVFVLDAWAKELGADGKVTMLSDGNGDFAKALGLDLDASGLGLGLRSHRYAMLVDDGIVKVLNVEDVPSDANSSSAEKLLESL
ncbi:MAG: peroxiredoxin [Rhodomicrobium sp.]|jgi:peroxiredoxin|nr:MAG: peroxiredoxin [Rhodomicrobium sp.]